MDRIELVSQIEKKHSMLCVGLDSDKRRIPRHILENFDDPVLEFNRQIIEATKDHCVAYKFNIAFYEAEGSEGWQSLQKSVELIPESIFKIADAKRGDIGNTSKLYARAFFEHMNFDAITVAPYMGEDSLAPFYEYDDKWVIILGLTSNKGSLDFQMQKLENGRFLYEEVISKSATLGNDTNTMFVVGATKTKFISQIREIIPDHFLLMPGIGKQGGDLKSSLEKGMNDDFGLLINSSRGIIFAEDGENFADSAKKEARKLNAKMRHVFD